ncbi:tRNA-dihydrouridine(20/20a) synthase-like protein [Drosera capensis]
MVSSSSPVKHFIIHSRKALLNGISPVENRSIPPLKYEYYYGLLRDFPDLKFTVNGGINTIEEVNAARSAGAHGPVLNLFQSEPVDAAFHECGTVKSLLEETLGAIPDCVLDSPVVKPIPGRKDLFSSVHNLMPPSYTAREPKLSYA